MVSRRMGMGRARDLSRRAVRRRSESELVVELVLEVVALPVVKERAKLLLLHLTGTRTRLLLRINTT